MTAALSVSMFLGSKCNREGFCETRKSAPMPFLIEARALSTSQEVKIRILFENSGQNVGHDVDGFVTCRLWFVLAKGDSIMEGLFVNFTPVIRINVAFGDGGFKEDALGMGNFEHYVFRGFLFFLHNAPIRIPRVPSCFL